MLASATAVLAALLATPGVAEVEVGARVETRAGEAPTGLRQTATGQTELAEQNQLIVAVSPTAGLRWVTPTSELRAISDTRILWRPVPLWDRRPLFLEALDVTHEARPSKRSHWLANARVSYGEEDYTSLVQQFANQPALPPARTMFTLNATGDGSWQASRRTSLVLRLGGTHRRDLDEQSATATAGLPNLPTQSLLTVTPGLRHILDRRSTLEALVGLSDTDVRGLPLTVSPDAHVNILSMQPELDLVRELNRRHQLRLAAGLTYAVILANPEPQRNWHPLAPLGRVELGSWLYRDRASSLRSTLVATTTWYTDPVLGVTVQRGNAEARLDAQLGPRWNAGLRAGFATDLNAPLKSVSATLPPLDETMVQLDLPFRYRWSSQVALDFGARYAERAPNLWASDFAWHYREIWLYATFNATTHRMALRRS